MCSHKKPQKLSSIARHMPLWADLNAIAIPHTYNQHIYHRKNQAKQQEKKTTNTTHTDIRNCIVLPRVC